MKEARYFYVPHAAQQHELPEEEAVHALRVLRLKAGDEIFLMDGEGAFYRSVVEDTSSKHCHYRIEETMRPLPTWEGRIHLAVAPTKMAERVEWMTEKAVEVGVDRITFLDCRFSERKVLKLPRMEKIVVAAMKQSRKPWKTELAGMTALQAFLEEPRKGRKFIAHCYEEIPRADFFDSITAPAEFQDSKDITVLVGPEGDFSIEEVREALAHGFEPVSLGQSRLRTETAGLAAVMMAHLARRI